MGRKQKPTKSDQILTEDKAHKRSTTEMDDNELWERITKIDDENKALKKLLKGLDESLNSNEPNE